MKKQVKATDKDLVLTLLLGWAGYWRLKKGQKGLAVLWFFTLGCAGIGWLADIIACFSAIRQSKQITQVRYTYDPPSAPHGLKEKWKVGLIVGGIFLGICVLSAVSGGNDKNGSVDSDPAVKETETEKVLTVSSESESETTQPTTTAVPENEHETVYDPLQQLFINISDNCKEADVVSYIDENQLCYTCQNYNGGKRMYKVAYSDSVALQKYADSGDYVEIAFSDDNSDVYYTVYSHKLKSALFYRYGDYFEFRFDNTDNKYHGYYFTDHVNTEKMTLEYDNGRSAEIRYEECDNAESALSKVLK